MKKILSTNQTILRKNFFYFFRKKYFVEIFFFNFFVRGFHPLVSPHRGCAPHAFGLRTLMGTGSYHFFIRSKNFFFLNRFNSTQKKIQRNRTKKKLLTTFYTFFTFQIDHISKNKNRIFVFVFHSSQYITQHIGS